MDLSLDGAQLALGDLVRRLLAGGPAAARAAEPLGYDPALWARLAEAGIVGMGLPETDGGGGAGLDLLTVTAEEIGRTLAPVPVVEHTVAGRLLARLCPEDPLLLSIAAGTICCTLALRPAVGGTVRLVPAGAVAETVLATDGTELVALHGEPPAPAKNLADAPVADRRRGTHDRVLASGPGTSTAMNLAVAEWRCLTAATLVGVADGAFGLVLDYVKHRHQFGRPIGSFQSVQHGLADLPGLVDGARLLTHEAAWALMTGERSQRGATGAELAVMALTFAGEVARDVTARGVQYHGGYGYAAEQDAQLFYRRARGWSLVAGPVAGELATLADLLFGPVGN